MKSVCHSPVPCKGKIIGISNDKIIFSLSSQYPFSGKETQTKGYRDQDRGEKSCKYFIGKIDHWLRALVLNPNYVSYGTLGIFSTTLYPVPLCSKWSRDGIYYTELLY